LKNKTKIAKIVKPSFINFKSFEILREDNSEFTEYGVLAIVATRGQAFPWKDQVGILYCIEYRL